jgi:hypothetical protein
LIVAGRAVDLDLADPAVVARDIRPVPRMALVVLAGRCIPRGPAPVALPARAGGPRLVLRAPVSVHVRDLVRLAPASVAQAA